MLLPLVLASVLFGGLPDYNGMVIKWIPSKSEQADERYWRIRSRKISDLKISRQRLLDLLDFAKDEKRTYGGVKFIYINLFQRIYQA